MSAMTEPASPADPPHALTLAQIAELAGVSTATVSKVLNGRTEVAPATRTLVEGLIHRHGYRRQKKRPKAAALIEVAFHEMDGPCAIEIIKGVQRVAREHHLAVVLSEMRERPTPPRGWVEEVLSRRSCGVIAIFCELTDAQRAQLRTRDIPVVLVDPAGAPNRVPSVGAGNWSGGLAATRHLLDLGHRRIAIITGAPHVLSSRARLDGYRAAMDAAGVPVDPALVVAGDFDVAEGLAHARALLALPDPPTAVFAGNDATAVGVYQAADQAGVRIPHDLSVVGFDDLPMAQWLVPPLTTIRQPLTDMAAAATGMLVALMDGGRPPQTRLEFTTQLVTRRSTAPPATG
ncbi:LacI family DNA-binding transcriptional regulator [Sphaerisporangium sp. NPDC004334]